MKKTLFKEYVQDCQTDLNLSDLRLCFSKLHVPEILMMLYFDKSRYISVSESREYIELINETHILKGYQHPVDIYPVQQVQHL